MALHVVIDGYNLLGASTGRGLGVDVERERERLIERLRSYRRLKGARVTVVFDGTRSGRLERSRETRGGVEIIYSRGGEQADHILKEMAGSKGTGLTIVTSDRDVADYARARGAVVVSSGEFSSILEMCEYAETKGVEEEDEGPPRRIKKGPSRRLPREERRRLRRLKKL